jgi:hypothetical protein
VFDGELHRQSVSRQMEAETGRYDTAQIPCNLEIVYLYDLDDLARRSHSARPTACIPQLSSHSHRESEVNKMTEYFVVWERDRSLRFGSAMKSAMSNTPNLPKCSSIPSFKFRDVRLRNLTGRKTRDTKIPRTL